MNSFILNADGISGLALGKPFTVSRDHPNYDQIVAAVKRKQWNMISQLANISLSVQKALDKKIKGSEVRVDVDAGIVYFRGQELNIALTTRIVDMMKQGFDVTPMVRFLENLMQNPSKVAIEELYLFMEASNLPLTEDGHFLAYKRVQTNMKSFHDNKTMHTVGKYTEMDRTEVDTNRHNTCSYGLHFCSQSYLPHYSSGEGHVLVLKINPKDVVSIPSDYDNAKGRACRYLVQEILTGETRKRIEKENVLRAPVVYTDSAPVVEGQERVSVEFASGYAKGYRDGRQKIRKPFTANKEFVLGYDRGHKDGTAHRAKATFVVVSKTEINVSLRFIEGYTKGYEAGRNRLTKVSHLIGVDDHAEGFDIGMRDGRGKRARRYR